MGLHCGVRHGTALRCVSWDCIAVCVMGLHCGVCCFIAVRCLTILPEANVVCVTAIAQLSSNLVPHAHTQTWSHTPKLTWSNTPKLTWSHIRAWSHTPTLKLGPTPYPKHRLFGALHTTNCSSFSALFYMCYTAMPLFLNNGTC
jgi:hypothetical protein